MPKAQSKDRGIRIVQVLLSPRIGGAESLVASLNAHWGGLGVHVSTLYLDGATNAPRGRLMRLFSLAWQLRKMRPDVIISHSAIPNVYARIAAPFGTPVLTVLHSAGDDFVGRGMRLAERVLSRRTSHVVAVSTAQEERYKSRFANAAKVIVIPNGISADIRCKQAASAELKSLVTIARIASQKNPVLWTEVANRIFGPVRLTWFGPPPTESSLKLLVDEFNSKQSAGRFVGPTADPATVLVSSDALFHPADREAHSIGILEAAAAGLPVLCSTAVAATLPSNVVALTFESGDRNSALAAIADLENRWQELSTRALAAAPEVKANYSIDNCAQQYMKLIEQILGRVGSN